MRRNNPRRGEAVYEFPSDFDISVCMKDARPYWHCVHLADDWHTCIVSPSAAISYVQLIFTQSLFFDLRKAASMHSHGCKRSWITPSDILSLDAMDWLSESFEIIIWRILRRAKAQSWICASRHQTTYPVRSVAVVRIAGLASRVGVAWITKSTN